MGFERMSSNVGDYLIVYFPHSIQLVFKGWLCA
jgi:hypothetical protein